MNLINVTSDANQKQTLVLPSGSTVVIEMYYMPMQLGWFFTSITYGSIFTLTSLRISNSPNMLYQWQNLIPFGFACFSTSQREPSQQEDFSSGASGLYLLTQAECQAYAAYIRGGSIPA